MRDYLVTAKPGQNKTGCRPARGGGPWERCIMPQSEDTSSASVSLEALVSRAERAGRSAPPVEAWNPPHCGEIDMAIDENGGWSYQGSPIDRPALARLFSSVLRREADGSFVLVTPAEKLTIRVADAPFVAVEMSDEAGRLRFPHQHGRRRGGRRRASLALCGCGGRRVPALPSRARRPRGAADARAGLRPRPAHRGARRRGRHRVGFQLVSRSAGTLGSRC